MSTIVERLRESFSRVYQPTGKDRNINMSRPPKAGSALWTPKPAETRTQKLH